MSALYNLEPQPTAKCILHTTAGDLLLELFAKQTPLASRNFLQHCLDGYYTNTIFHRLVKDFIIQGGDPTGTGAGGESALNHGQPFQDEIHTRLKFIRRGLLGMANEGKDSNGSQFFLTLAATPELQGRHTMFGRIEGDTIFNLMKMAEAEMEEGADAERPLYPTRVTGAEILVNPFEDMVPRVKEAPRTREDEGRKEGAGGVKKRKKPAGKNVLSFAGGDEDGEGEEVVKPVKKKSKANPKLVSVGEEQPDELNNTKLPDAPSVKERTKQLPQAPEPEEEVVPDVMEDSRAQPIPARKPTEDTPDEDKDDDDEQSDDDDDRQRHRQRQQKSALDTTNAEIAALKASMKRTVDTGPKEQHQKPKSALESMIPSTSTRGRKRGKVGDEKGAMDLFKQFKSKLEVLPAEKSSGEDAITSSRAGDRSTGTGDRDYEGQGEDGESSGSIAKPSSTANGQPTDPTDEEEVLCDLHFIANCQSCKAWIDENDPDAQNGEGGGGGGGDNDDDNDPSSSWMSHSLTFAKDTLGKDLEWKRKMEEIEIIDPREKARELGVEGGKKGERGRDRLGKGKGKRTE
ncbi:cyclophilin-like protein [Hortaea werneckii]|nr:cyclophilin-like protein [Hortaea werneckii]KAI7101150.1 cyclophilin-like protein [Hortaea werneckii]KAI7243517.1 cyclophilin-like protein [Hortaea werneckii]KAI7331087.1 cyclophilin-like protein [Hortaea werneckii]KAI7395931.1 cyclophilin-like protein [Hortaea werneckii]